MNAFQTIFAYKPLCRFYILISEPQSLIHFHRKRVLLFCCTLIVLSCDIISIIRCAVNATKRREECRSFHHFRFPHRVVFYFSISCEYSYIHIYMCTVCIIIPNQKQSTGRPFSRFLIIICKTTYCVVPVVNILLL